MGLRLRENVIAISAAGLATLLMGWLSLADWSFTDYDAEARPALDALMHGHLLQFLKIAPAYGGSLLLRAPFAAVPRLWSGGELSTFRAAAAPCMAAAAILGVWLVARMRERGASRAARALVLALCVANPIALPALEYGHPEELLGAVLGIFAIVAATRGRPVLSGVLLGVAVANKQWAVLAVGPMLIALPQRRILALLTAGAVAAAVLAPFQLAGSYASQTSAAAQTGALFNPWDWWWFFGNHSHAVRDLAGHVRPGYRVAPAFVGTLAHPLIVAVMVPLTVLYALCRRPLANRNPHDPLLLLALLLLLRCALDPWDFSYYPLPLLLVLTTWEALRFNRVPVLALGATFASWLALQEVTTAKLQLTPDMQALVFLAITVPAALAIAAGLYLPGLAQRLASRSRQRDPVPAAV